MGVAEQMRFLENQPMPLVEIMTDDHEARLGEMQTRLSYLSATLYLAVLGLEGFKESLEQKLASSTIRHALAALDDLMVIAAGTALAA